MSAEAAQTIRDWIRHLHSADFAQIAVKSPEARQDVGEKVIDVNNNQITEENEEAEEEAPEENMDDDAGEEPPAEEEEEAMEDDME